MFSFGSPERRSSAGVWMAPQAATTALARTVTRWPAVVRASHSAGRAGVDEDPLRARC